MYYEVYIDTLFLINFAMDLLVLFTVSKILRQSTTWLRLLFAASAGAAIVCVLFIFPISNGFVNTFVTYILTGFVMVKIGFNPKVFKEGFKLFIMLYIMTFLIGGMITAVYYYTKIGYYFTKLFQGNIIESLDLKSLVLISMVVLVLLFYGIRYMVNLFKIEASLYSVEIELKGNQVQVVGLLDTGNSLYDPITNKPVMIAEFETVKGCLPEPIKHQFIEALGQPSDELYLKMATSHEYKFRLIPFHSVGKESGILIGFIPDRISISCKEETKILTDIVIAIYNKKLSGDNSYQALLHPAMIK